MNPKYAQQHNQYKYPYHWIPEWNGKYVIAGRRLSWALEYCSYMGLVKSLVSSQMPAKVLDVGCGDGRLADFLRDVPEINYVGLDTSKKAIVMANAMNPDGKYICGNVSDINEKFPCITCVEVLEHIPDEEISGFLSDISSKLDQGGQLIISVPTDIRPTHKKHYRHYNLSML